MSGHVYELSETARPALLGMGLMAAGLILWAFFVAMDARFEASSGEQGDASSSDGDFRFKDVLGVLGNKNFWLLGLLCVLFYSSIIAFKKFATSLPARVIGMIAGQLDPVEARRLEKDLADEVNRLLGSFVIAGVVTPKDANNGNKKKKDSAS